ncbi:MAG: hypothetical protein Q9227_004361 [Pyrenula ochraceoflavens]
MQCLSIFLALSSTAIAGTLLWDGRFNDISLSTDLNNWSFSNEVGPYQYYIHGTGNVTEYVNLSSDYKNPTDSSSKQGVKITIDSTSNWNNDGMRRTELIPQTTAAINKGKVVYHFSISRAASNPPGAQEEHQVCFFESHFTELKYGLISGEQGTTSDPTLRWDVGGQSQWNTSFDAGVWHNMAYEIDFDAGTVGFWHSTGADDLVQTIAPMTASTSSNGADWHLGVLRLAPSGSGVAADADNGPEDWLFSGIYVESGDVTTSVAGPGGAAASAGNASASVSAVVPLPTGSAITSSPSSSASEAATSSPILVAAVNSTIVTSASSSTPPTTLITETVSPIPASPISSAVTSTPSSSDLSLSSTTPLVPSAPASTGTGGSTGSSESKDALIAEVLDLIIELMVKYEAGQGA